MTLVTDLHVHSRYANSTSPQMTLPGMSRAARRKGVDLLGTGDCTHPGWLEELRRELRDCGHGVYAHNGTRYLVTGEVSLVWRQAGRGRRVHLVLLVCSLDDAARIQEALSERGNIAYDGRPMLGLSAQAFCELIWERAPETLVIPAHIWTPWYAVLGDKSGFDSLQECFGGLVDRITAIETGLSSDPGMNRRVSSLDGVRLVSFSDAHSPARIAREATVLDLKKVSFSAVSQALATGQGYVGTIEFYPEQGKYHYDGHRVCGVSLAPPQSMSIGNRCPICGKPLTLGVLHRVTELADRDVPRLGKGIHRSTVPLVDILSDVLGVGAGSKTVAKLYEAMLDRYGTELAILLDHPIDDFGADVPEQVVDGIARVRQGDVVIEPGYDGMYGKVCLGRARGDGRGREGT